MKNKIQNDIANAISRNKNGLVVASVRAGKTRACILGLQKIKPKNILWVTVSEKLRDIDIPDEFKKWDAENLLNVTKIICYQSLYKELGRYDYIILDEYQSITYANMENILNGDLCGNIIGLTGTHPRNQEKIEILKILGLRKIYSLSVDDAAKMGIVADYKITIANFALDNKSLNVKNKGKLITEQKKYNNLSYAIEKAKFSYNDPKFLYMARARFLYNCQSRKNAWNNCKEYLKDKRGIIFYPYIKDAESERCFYHSKSDDIGYNAFKNEECDILGLVKSGGIGHTYKNLDYVLITQATSDNTGITSQMIGRSLLFRPGYTANIIILCAKDTQDEVWVSKTLERFSHQKVNFIDLWK
jgi:superfamily II DNA or RNA helicase